MGYFAKLYPQSVYRTPKGKVKERIGSQSLDVELPDLAGQLTESQILSLKDQILSLNAVLVMALLPEELHGKPMPYIDRIYKAMKLKKVSKSEHEMVMLDLLWEEIEGPVLNRIKLGLMDSFFEGIFQFFSEKISKVVGGYMRSLPRHVSVSEGDDLQTVAQLELIETIKVWKPSEKAQIWTLAYTRIGGAMKDHIRYVTKSDPSRFYEWVTDAAHMLKSFSDASFEDKIETGYELAKAMECLTPRERKIVILHAEQDKTFKEISKEVDVSESQISRIYKKSVEKLKKELHQEPEL